MSFWYVLAGIGLLIVLWQFVVRPILARRESEKLRSKPTPLRASRSDDSGRVVDFPSASAPPPAPPPVPVDPAVREAELRDQLASATDSAECLEIWDDLPKGSPLENQAVAKFYILAGEELAALTTLDEMFDFMRAVPFDEDNVTERSFEPSEALFSAAITKALGIATTTDEALEVLDVLEEFNNVEPAETERVIRRALELAQDANDADTVYQRTESDTELEKLCVRRQLELCTTVSEAESAWTEYGVDSDYGRMAITRGAELIAAGAPYEEE